MTKDGAELSAPLRIVPGADGVSIWSAELFGEPQAPRLRDFIARAFAVEEVRMVEIRRASGFGRVGYGASAAPAAIWRRLAGVLRPNADPADAGALGPANFDARPAAHLYLDHPAPWPVRVSRVGSTLSTWRMRREDEDRLRLSHPILRHRPGFGFRLEERLAAILGVDDVEARRWSSDVLVRLDRRIMTPERLARELEKAWPALIEGADEPPSAKRLMAAGTMLTIAAAGQFAVPALRPVAVGAVVVYSAPNVATAFRQLRQGVIGLPALYSFGLGLMLMSGLPLTGTIMASLMQLWPYLAHRTLVNRQRRLFAAHRRRPAWARSAGTDADIEVHVDDLKPGDEVAVRAGETVPVDGVVASGLAALADHVGGPRGGLRDVGPGDLVHAGSTLRDGSLTVRVERSGASTAAAHVGAILPYSAFQELPSLYEAERVANRNARPALALAALNLLTVRSPRFSQAVIRPDYVTAPRLSARLAALYDLAAGLQRGVLFKRPAALDILSGIDVLAFDDGARLDARRVEVDRVEALDASTGDVVGYAVAALGADRSERARALASFAARKAATRSATAHDLRRRAGAILFRDDRDRQIAIVSEPYLQQADISLQGRLRPSRAARDAGEPAPLYVLRDGRPIGVVAFRRKGDLEARAVVDGLRRQNPRLRFVHVSSRKKALARAAADALGVDFAFGDLDAQDKASALRGLGRRAIWVGDGTAPDAQAVMAASDVSVSTAGFAGAPDDRADVLLLDGRLSGLLELSSLAAERRARLNGDYRTVYAANLIGVAGAFLANFGSLQSGLLSNLGSGLVYARHVRRLNALIAKIDAERARASG